MKNNTLSVKDNSQRELKNINLRDFLKNPDEYTCSPEVLELRKDKVVQKYQGVSYGVQPIVVDIPVNVELDGSQRDFNVNRIKQYIKAVKGFDWNLFGLPTVVRYPDNSIKCVNGQHRLMILQVLMPEILTVKAHLIDFSHLSEKEAIRQSAKLFANTNGNLIKKVSPEELFWAEYLAEDPQALRLADLLTKCEFSCGYVNSEMCNSRVQPEPYINHHGEEDIWPGFLACKSVKFPNFAKLVGMCNNNDTTPIVYAAQLINDTWIEPAMNDLLWAALVRLFTTQGYEQLQDPSTKCGAEFAQWFNTLSTSFPNINSRVFKFRDTLENPDWSKCGAYSLFRMFKDYSTKCKISAVGLKNQYYDYKENSE